ALPIWWHEGHLPVGSEAGRCALSGADGAEPRHRVLLALTHGSQAAIPVGKRFARGRRDPAAGDVFETRLVSGAAAKAGWRSGLRQLQEGNLGPSIGTRFQ